MIDHWDFLLFLHTEFIFKAALSTVQGFMEKVQISFDSDVLSQKMFDEEKLEF